MVAESDVKVAPTVWSRPSAGPSLDRQTVIQIDEAHAAVKSVDSQSTVGLVPLTNDECDLAVVLFKLPPNYVGIRHSHEADTVYIVRQGTFIVEGEGAFEVGSIRWVKAGTPYGPEKAGPEGCEVFLIAAGKFPLATIRAE